VKITSSYSEEFGYGKIWKQKYIPGTNSSKVYPTQYLSVTTYSGSIIFYVRSRLNVIKSDFILVVNISN